MSDNQLSINLTGLSPACKRDLLLAITRVLDQNAEQISSDLAHYTPGEAFDDMDGWRNAAQEQSQRLKKSFPKLI